MDLCGKMAVITGGKRIGRVAARELAERGMNLVLSYRGSKDEAEQTVQDVERQPPCGVPVRACRHPAYAPRRRRLHRGLRRLVRRNTAMSRLS
jgi:NAD(P)-dependent dehydrogenase (short-subunit alcohol dehydrogenase family)